jgi:membrane-bound lytic murein transglycosylase F
MVAAVVYQESKFSISSTSSRGAQGLMQVMPQTGARYGVDNLLDPEQNIHAGTSHLCRLQKMFCKYDLSHEELVKFTLAAYNAGEGRIIDCRNLAAAKGMDNTRWEEIVKVIPLMREDSILEEESVKLGKFQGHETIAYIDNVMSHYDAICQICPTSF